MGRNLSSNWTKKKIGELCDVSRGSSPRPIHDPRYFDGGTIPWIKIADATKSGKYLYETKQHVNEYGASFSRLLPPGTILVAASGTLGYTQILGVEGCAHDGWLILQNLHDFDRDYAYYALHLMEQHFYNSAYGAAIQNINTTILEETEIPYPPLPTQRKIGAILSAYDNMIENNTRRIRILEEMAQAIYREWFVQFRFPGHEGVRMVESPVGQIPEGWTFKNLCDIAEVNPEQITKENQPDVIHYIDISSVSTGRIDNVTEMDSAVAPGRARRLVKDGDIIWSTVRPNRKSFALLLDPPHNTIVSTGFAVIRPVHVPFSYLYLAITTNEFTGYLTNHATGAAYPAVNQGDFERAIILIPSIDIISLFHQTVSNIYLLIQNLSIKNNNLRQQRDILLPRLVNGELNVEEREISHQMDKHHEH